MAYVRPTRVRATAQSIGVSLQVPLTDVVGDVSFSTVADGSTWHYEIRDASVALGKNEWGLGTKTTVAGQPTLVRSAVNVLGPALGVLTNFATGTQNIYGAQLGDVEVLPNVTADPAVASLGQEIYRADVDDVRVYVAGGWTSQVRKDNLLASFGNIGVNRILIGPIVGGATAPTFRTLVKADQFMTTAYTDNANIFNVNSGQQVFRVTDAGTNTIPVVVQIDHESNGSPVAGFGVAQQWLLASDTVTQQVAAERDVLWVEATDISRKARVIEYVYDAAGAREFLRAESDGSKAITILPVTDKGGQVYNIKAYGAIGDGTSHLLSGKYANLAAAQVDYPFATALSQELDWAALQLAINTAHTTNFSGNDGGTVFIPSGQYLLADTVLVQSLYGLNVVGMGKSSMLRWNGASTDYVFKLDDAYHCAFRNFWLMHNTACKAGFLSINGAGATFIPSACLFEDLSFGGYSTGGFTYGVDINSSGAAGDNNNELHRFVRCDFASYTTAAVHVNASQAHALVFSDCIMDGMGVAPYGIYCEYGSYIHSLRGSGGAHTDSDFYLKDFNVASTINGWNSEGSVRLATIWGSATCGTAPVTITGCRWAGLPPANGRIIVNNSPGILNITGNIFESDNANRCVVYSAGLACGNFALVHTGNFYKGLSAYAASALQGNPTTVGQFGDGSIVDEGNLYYDPADGSVHCFDPIEFSQSFPGLFFRLPDTTRTLQGFIDANLAGGLRIFNGAGYDMWLTVDAFGNVMCRNQCVGVGPVASSYGLLACGNGGPVAFAVTTGAGWHGTAPTIPAWFAPYDMANTTVSTGLVIHHGLTSGTPGVGFGVAEKFKLDSTTNTGASARDAYTVEPAWVTATDASRKVRVTRYVYGAVAGVETKSESMREESDGVQALITLPNLAISGLTGATQASRYVGATAGGAPVSGTFAIGDYVLDQTGKWWICTVAGTPGTWVGHAPSSGTNTGDQTITLTGNVTGTGTGSFAATIAAGAVTYAKIQNVSATSRILGRKTAGAGSAEECTLSEVLDFVGSAAQGDILYRDSATWARLGAGTAGQFLETQGASANPIWASLSGVAVTSFNTRQGAVTLTSGDVTAALGDANIAYTDVANVFNQTSVAIKGATAVALTIKPNETLTGARTLNLVTGDATRSLTFTADASIGGTTSGTNTGDQTITLTGNVTGSGTGSFAATIAAAAVTYAKIQNISATSRILGRKTAAAGSTEECTLSDVLDFVGSAVQGDILYRDSATWTRLGAGTSGKFLQTKGTSANPVWTSGISIANVQTSSAGIGNAADTTDDTLFTYSLPSGSLAVNGQSVRVLGVGTFAANANNKQVKIWVGGTAVGVSGILTFNALPFTFELEFTRLDATHVSVMARFIYSATVGASQPLTTLTVTPNLVVADLSANATIIKVTGASTTTGAANDVLGYLMKTWFEN